MARENYQTRLEAIDARRVDEFKEEQDIETKAEATRRLLRRGLDDWEREQDGKTVRHGLSAQVTTLITAAVGGASGAFAVGVVF